MFSELFRTSGFMPHGYCLLWTPSLLWTYVVSDSLIGLSYYSIPFALFYFVRRRTDLPFIWMFVLFGIFIAACGTTHLSEVLDIWIPLYWLDAAIKAVTAVVSVLTAVLLWPLLPRALALPSPGQLAEANRRLEEEVAERQRIQAELESVNANLEQRVAERTAELRELNGALRREVAEKVRAREEAIRLNGVLEQRVAERTEELESFSYSVSHDLRAPLRAIDGFAAMLKEDHAAQLDSEGGRLLGIIQDNAQKMGNLISDLLTLSRLGRQHMELAAIDMPGLVRSALQEVDAAAPDAGAAEVRIGAMPTARGDPTQLRQVWVNLLANAVKFSSKESKSEIEVGGYAKDTESVYFVRDNGAGFDMKYYEKLFGVFQRLHRDDEFPGTGVGLAIVRRVVQRHGGRAWAEGVPGTGATFYFSLPRESGTDE